MVTTAADISQWLIRNAPAVAEHALKHELPLLEQEPDSILDQYFALPFATALVGEPGLQFLPPGVAPCSRQGATRAGEGLLADWNPAAGLTADDLVSLQDDPAGKPAAAWLTSFTFIGLTGRSAGVFVDTRKGAHQGCVMQWERDNGALRFGPIAQSVEDFLEKALEGMRTGVAFGMELEVEDGLIYWY